MKKNNALLVAGIVGAGALAFSVLGKKEEEQAGGETVLSSGSGAGVGAKESAGTVINYNISLPTPTTDKTTNLSNLATKKEMSVSPNTMTNAQVEESIRQGAVAQDISGKLKYKDAGSNFLAYTGTNKKASSVQPSSKPMQTSQVSKAPTLLEMAQAKNPQSIDTTKKAATSKKVEDVSKSVSGIRKTLFGF